MTKAHPLILASGSRYRRELLLRLGLDFDTISADVDESRRNQEAPDALATRLAAAKADVVARQHPDAFVIGSDQVIAVDDEILSKPGTVERARAQLALLAGRRHRLLTAVCIVAPDASRAESIVEYEMKLRELTAREIEEYVEVDEPLDCAGSYRIEAGGIALFEYLRGDDYTAIIGLPLTAVRRHLDELGFFRE